MAKPQPSAGLSPKVNRLYRRLHWRQRRREGRAEIRQQLEETQEKHMALKKGQLARRKDVDYYCVRPMRADDKRIFWKQHRMAEQTEIRRQLEETQEKHMGQSGEYGVRRRLRGMQKDRHGDAV